ncbi:MAG TPA: NB-ARC domain-containing protein [Acidimicrobiia bacterium]|nr:NB-ARC domain-containing protein [Acidimicrobiia bacterium]
MEGSTRRWRSDAEEMAAALASDDRVLHAAMETHGGAVFKSVGDGICAVFPSVVEAVRAAVDAQCELTLPVRVAVHTGEAVERDGDFFGVTLSHCARLLEAGHGGQVLVSASAVSVAGDGWGPNIGLRDLGEHRLRDLGEPERVFQVVAPGLERDFPPLRSLEAVRHNLPVQRSSFVGRHDELTEVCERLLARQLVTLTGIGGCGKTRLALEAAVRLVEDFPEGVFFVDLAPLSDSELLGQAVAAGLGLHLLDTSVEGLVGYLAQRRVLVLLDNCEHLLDACAALVDALLARCLDVRVLATSREPLGVEGEQVFRVPSLSIETEAMSLFVDRARGVRPDLRTDPETEGAILEICRRLDGIPLAIELAAARTAHLAPAEILERLSDRFRLLTGGRRRVERQQTLAAAIDWSHSLLSEDEKTLFRRLAVFRGSFSLRAAEGICHEDALELLGSLVAKSLVNLEDQDAQTRYRLLETVRLYAEERLVEAGEAEQFRSSHRDWFLGWIESFPVGQLVALSGGHQLTAEADNLTAALEWCRQQRRPDLLVRIASRMTTYWWDYVRVAEMAAWWDELVGALLDLAPDLRAAALVLGVQHAMAIGAFEEMDKLSADALKIAAPDSWVAAWAWSIQALYWTYADPERGRHCIEEGRTAAAAAGTPEIEQMTALWSANLITGREDADEGLKVLEALPPAAVDSEFALNEIVIGLLATFGQPEQAAARLAAAPPPRTPLRRFAWTFTAALIASSEGQRNEMAEHLRALAAIVREYAIPLGEESCLIGFAALAVDEGDYARASHLLATVQGAAPFPFRTPLQVAVYRRCAGMVRAALDPATARRCRARGAATPVNEALDTELQRLRPDEMLPNEH